MKEWTLIPFLTTYNILLVVLILSTLVLMNFHNLRCMYKIKKTFFFEKKIKKTRIHSFKKFTFIKPFRFDSRCGMSINENQVECL